MNLVEQQEKARALPMQYLQQAVNGQSVELAPWIATAELQRRTTADQHMQAAKGPQGPQPTVKDQIEKKAGLLATQAAQLAQATQAQQSSPPPGPIPGGIPEAEFQPEEPVMAAHGGLMNAPVSFNFAHGGILGYAGDEPQGSRVRSRLPNESFEQYRQRLMALDAADQDRADAEARAQQDMERKQEIARRQGAGQMLPRSPFVGAPINPTAPTAASVSTAARRDDRAPLPSLQGITAALPKPAPRPQVAQAQDQRPAQVNQEQKPAPAQKELEVAGQQTMDPAGKAALTFATGVTPERTLADIIAEQRAIKKEAGTDQPMGVNQAAQQARQDEIQKRRDAHAKELAYSAYVQGLVGTPGSAKLAYDRTLATALADEGTYGQAKYKNIAELEAAQRAAAEKQQTALETPVAAGRVASAAAAKDRATTGANIYGTNVQAKTSKYNTDEHVKSSMAIAKLQERGANARLGSTEARQAANELRDRERAIEADITALTSRANKLTGSFSVEDRKELADVNEQLKNARAQKALIRGGPAAAPAGVKMTPTQAAALAKYGAK